MTSAGQKIRALDFTAAVTASQSADESGFTDTTFVAGANVCGVTFVAPTSGRVLLIFGFRMESNTGDGILGSAEVREGSSIGSGTVVSSAADATSVETAGTATANFAAERSRLVQSLTPGDTYNARTMHRVTAGNGDIFDRSILVVPVP